MYCIVGHWVLAPWDGWHQKVLSYGLRFWLANVKIVRDISILSSAQYIINGVSVNLDTQYSNLNSINKLKSGQFSATMYFAPQKNQKF